MCSNLQLVLIELVHLDGEARIVILVLEDEFMATDCRVRDLVMRFDPNEALVMMLQFNRFRIIFDHDVVERQLEWLHLVLVSKERHSRAPPHVARANCKGIV